MLSFALPKAGWVWPQICNHSKKPDMKKMVICSLALVLFISCNNSSGTNEEPTPTPTNVQNVNGNIPDTSSGSNLNGTMPVDSSKLKDSVNR